MDNQWVDGTVKQRVLLRLGRLDELLASGRLDSLIQSLGITAWPGAGARSLSNASNGSSVAANSKQSLDPAR